MMGTSYTCHWLRDPHTREPITTLGLFAYANKVKTVYPPVKSSAVAPNIHWWREGDLIKYTYRPTGEEVYTYDLKKGRKR